MESVDLKIPSIPFLLNRSLCPQSNEFEAMKWSPLSLYLKLLWIFSLEVCVSLSKLEVFFLLITGKFSTLSLDLIPFCLFWNIVAALTWPILFHFGASVHTDCHSIHQKILFKIHHKHHFLPLAFSESWLGAMPLSCVPHQLTFYLFIMGLICIAVIAFLPCPFW